MKNKWRDMDPLVIPTLPKDESLAAFKTWLLDECKKQGITLLETDLTESDWIEQHESYWQSRK